MSCVLVLHNDYCACCIYVSLRYKVSVVCAMHTPLGGIPTFGVGGAGCLV